MKKINNYRLQYWLYAILNKKFGKEVVFKRDSLHAMYEVNRHGFSITSHNINLNIIQNYLKEYLETCNYKEKNDCGIHYNKDKTFISLDKYDKHLYCIGRVY